MNSPFKYNVSVPCGKRAEEELLAAGTNLYRVGDDQGRLLLCHGRYLQ